MLNSHSQIDDILNFSDGVYMTIDFDWVITYTNNLTENMLLVSAKELIGSDLRDTLPDVVSKFYKTLSATLLNQKDGYIVSRYGPTQKILELQVFPTATGMLAIFHDVTIKEEQLKTIRDSEIQHRAILDTVIGALVAINSKGLITSFNHVAEQMFGYQATELIGLNVSILMPEKERQVHEGYTNYSDLNETRVLNKYRELHGTRKDGSTFPIELNVSPMNIEDSYGYIGYIRDITERKIAENKILEEKVKAEKSSRAKSEFLASMSHEFFTPLNSIMGFSQLLEMDSELEEKHKDQIIEIYNAGKHLADMVDDVLNFTNIDAGEFDINSEVVSLEMVIIESVAMLGSLLKETNVSINVNPDCYRYKLRADPDRLRQVIYNLLSNAIKYNCDNGKVNIDCKENDNNMLRVIITDTGSGIDALQLRELFEPFNRLGKEAGNIQGSGIGLCVTKLLTEAMDGIVGVESTVGEGSQFWIELPLVN